MHPDQFLRVQCAMHISYHSVGLRIAICLCMKLHVNILLFICRGPQSIGVNPHPPPLHLIPPTYDIPVKAYLFIKLSFGDAVTTSLNLHYVMTFNQHSINVHSTL